MIKATIKDREKIILLLSQAFRGNQSVNYIVRQDKYKTTAIYALMEYSFDLCFYFGEVYLMEDKTGCALLLGPKSKRTTLRSIWLDINLIFNAIGIRRMSIALKRESAIKKLQWKEDHIYLWFIGVEPSHHRQGIGSNLLREVIDHARGMALPVCLETSTLTNISWYQKYGFEIYNQLDLGYLLYFLKTTF
jgi:Acetyltransferase (GNAT) family